MPLDEEGRGRKESRCRHRRSKRTRWWPKKKRKKCAAMAPDAPWNSIERSRPTASAASTAKHHIGVDEGARAGPLLLFGGGPVEFRRALLAASGHSFANVRAAEPE